PLGPYALQHRVPGDRWVRDGIGRDSSSRRKGFAGELLLYGDEALQPGTVHGCRCVPRE
ncbi:unnamed protein product, partial [Ectocarpus sp. 13 AM-2016]